MTELEQSIGYKFEDKELLKTALTHSSYANERREDAIKCNERLEFLGDSILGMTVAEFLFKSFPNMQEGDMTRRRAELVCEKSLHEVAVRLDLGRYMLLGNGEEQSGGRTRTSILADAVEAVIAAIYLDGGRVRAVSFIKKQLLMVKKAEDIVNNQDYKTALQELVQKKSGQVLKYELEGESGPDHNKQFISRVLMNGEEIGTGSGKSKKESEQFAAKDAFGKLKER